MNRMMNFWTFREYMAPGTFPPVDPIVEGLLNRSELALISATAKTGKTWLSLHLALCVTHGVPFLGRFQTKKGKVFLVQTEVGPGTFQDRISRIENLYDPGAKIRQEHPIISTDRVKLDTHQGLKTFAESVREIAPSLVILDSWYTFHTKDESSATDMAPLLTNVREVAKTSNCCILIVHHQGKRGDSNGSQGQAGHAARGSSAFADVPDALFSLTRRTNGLLNLACELRSQESPEPLVLAFKKETLSFQLLENEPSESPSFHKETTDLILKEILEAGQGGLPKSELVTKVEAASGKKPRTIEEAVRTLIDRKQIVRLGDGKSVRYATIDSNEEHSQLRNPLGSCVRAKHEVDHSESLKITFSEESLREPFFENLDSTFEHQGSPPQKEDP